ncbi:MAG TPA: TonB-dependent receptor [Hyphomicrobiales bacterium]|nr:TonB-dependent receptor [Hyphomicrobiales bacterium]
MQHSSKALARRALALAVMLGTAAGAVQAQDNTLESIVITADRRQSELRDTPASIFSVGADALEIVRPTHITEVLARVPGTWVSRGNGQESLISIRSPVLTGTGSCGAFQTSLDGIAMRAPGFCNVNQLFEANTEQAGAIEVIRGPGSVLYGANALHGAINVISDPISDNFSSDYSYELGPHRYNRVRGTISNTVGQHGYRISANGNTDDGYKHDSGFDQQKLSAMHQYRGNDFSATTSLQATNLNQETAGYIEGHDAYKDDDLKRFNPNPESFRDAQSYRLSSRLNWVGDAVEWTVTPYYRKADMTFLQHYLPGLPLEENGQKSLGLQVMAASRDTGPLVWNLGLDYEITDGYLRETQYSPTEGAAALQEQIPVGKHYDFTVDAQLISPYALVKYHLTEQDQFSVGLRYEERKYDYDNHMIDGRTRDDGTPCGFGGCRFNRPADRSDTYDNVSAQLGWIHDFDARRQVYVNVAKAFRAPETNEIYRLQNNQNVADLDSEEARSIELGYRASIDRFSYALSAYYMDKENVIFQDSNRENHSGAETRHRGIELNTAWAINDAWRLNVAATYARHTYEGTLNPGPVNLAGLDIDTAPRISGSAQLQWRISNDRNLELEWVHMGKYYLDEANTVDYPGHELVNLRYQANWGQGWYYGARVTNLFNTDYAERADYGFGNERYFVGEPISAYLSVGRRL